ncbi:MAG: MORN repeat-containing protein [Cyclobacteriaceae bacterium]
MKKPVKNIVIYSLLTLFVFLSIFFFLRVSHLQSRLNTYQDNQDHHKKTSEILKQMIAIDSLLLNKDYNKARIAYEKLLDEMGENEFTSVIQKRINKLKEIENNLKNQKSFGQGDIEQTLLNKTQQIDSLSRQLSESQNMQVDKIDSLRFALAKANMRLESLTQQIADKSKNNYLKFSNEKGTEIYFVGEIKAEKANGSGVALYSNGSRYEGEWKNNLRHGKGVFYWPDGEYYSGEFVRDQRQGEGKYYWPNGEMFAGKWDNDKRNGEGVFYGKNGNVVAKGIWQNNELVKKE